MKRYWYLMAIAATLLASCNKDEEETEIQGFKVLEYRPAPGQFINEGFDCQTMEEANAYAEERFNKKLYVSLGSFGGYITVKMPKEIKNRKGYDLGKTVKEKAESSSISLNITIRCIIRTGLKRTPIH